jgi:hypothetical protein
MGLRTRILIAAGVVFLLVLAALGLVFDAGRKLRTVLA